MRFLATLIDIYIWIVIIRVVLSWVNVNSQHPALRFMEDLTEPVLSRIRGVLPEIGGLDLSPLVLILGLSVLKNALF